MFFFDASKSNLQILNFCLVRSSLLQMIPPRRRGAGIYAGPLYARPAARSGSCGQLLIKVALDHIWLSHLCLCQTDIWKSFEMVRSRSERKMQSDDGKMMKFMISFGALWKLVSEEVVMHECLRALDAQTTIFVVPVSAWRSTN